MIIAYTAGKSPCLSKYVYIIVRTKSQLGWLNLPHLPILPPPVTAWQRVVIIPGKQHEEEINGYGGRDSEKREKGKFQDESGKYSYSVSYAVLFMTIYP